MHLRSNTRELWRQITNVTMIQRVHLHTYMYHVWLWDASRLVLWWVRLPGHYIDGMLLIVHQYASSCCLLYITTQCMINFESISPSPMDLSGFLEWCLVVNTCVHIISCPSSLILLGLYEDNMTICSYQQVGCNVGFDSWWYDISYILHVFQLMSLTSCWGGITRVCIVLDRRSAPTRVYCAHFSDPGLPGVFDNSHVAQEIIDILCSGLPGCFISVYGPRRIPSIPAGVMEVRVYVAAAEWLLIIPPCAVIRRKLQSHTHVNMRSLFGRV